MSFTCQKCKKSQPPKSKPIRRVVKRYGTSKDSISPLEGQIAREEDWCATCVKEEDRADASLS